VEQRLYPDDFYNRFLHTEDIRQASLKLDNFAMAAPRQNDYTRYQIQVQIESLVDRATECREGPGGDSERFAAQLVYDSVLSQILVNGVVQDSELVREVLSAGSEELCGIVFAPLQNARAGHFRALLQVAALQEALDQTDREVLWMREEAEIVSIHAASSRAMMTLAGRTTSIVQPAPQVTTPAKAPSTSQTTVDICSTQCDLDKEQRLEALEAQLSHEVAACEQQAENSMHVLGEVMRASWNSGADLAALKSQLDLFKTRADMTDRLKAQLAAGSKKELEDEGRLLGLTAQIRTLQVTVVGEEVLRRDLMEKDQAIARKQVQMEELLLMQDEYRKLQQDQASLVTSSVKLTVALRKLDGISNRFDRVAASEALCKNLAVQALNEGAEVCKQLTHQRAHALQLGVLNIDFEKQLSLSASKMQTCEASLAAQTLKLTQEQLTTQQLHVRLLTLEAQLRDSAKAQQEALENARETTKKMSQVQEALLSSDRLLLAARALCAERDEQLEKYVAQIGVLEGKCMLALNEAQRACDKAQAADGEVGQLKEGCTSLQHELDRYMTLTPGIQAELKICQRRVEQAEEEFKAVVATLDNERARIETLHEEKAELQQELAVLSGVAANLEDQFQINADTTQKVIKLSEELEWLRTSHNEGAENLVQLQHDLMLKESVLLQKESVLLQTNNEMDAVVLQLQHASGTLDRANQANAELQGELQILKQQLNSHLQKSGDTKGQHKLQMEALQQAHAEEMEHYRIQATLKLDSLREAYSVEQDIVKRQMKSLQQSHKDEMAHEKEKMSGKEATLSEREMELAVKQNEVSLLKVSVNQALHDQYLLQQTADSKDEEAADARLEVLKLRSSTWEERGAVSLAPTPRDADNASVDSFQGRPNTQRSPRYAYKKGLF